MPPKIDPKIPAAKTGKKDEAPVDEVVQEAPPPPPADTFGSGTFLFANGSKYGK